MRSKMSSVDPMASTSPGTSDRLPASGSPLIKSGTGAPKSITTNVRVSEDQLRAKCEREHEGSRLNGRSFVARAPDGDTRRGESAHRACVGTRHDAQLEDGRGLGRSRNSARSPVPGTTEVERARAAAW